MTPAAALTVTAAACLLLGSVSTARSNVQADSGALPSIDFGNLTDRIENIYNNMTETTANTTPDVASQNITSFLEMMKNSEGTASAMDPYAVCFGYKHTISDFANHPAVTGEWMGEKLPDAMCANAGFGPGCVSTAAGAYQIIKPSWLNVSAALGLTDFGAANQDAAAVELIRRRGALEDVKAGRVDIAIGKCRNEWASLPGNYAKQGQRSVGDLVAWYQQNGGVTA